MHAKTLFSRCRSLKLAKMSEQKLSVVESRKKQISQLKKRKPWFRRPLEFAYAMKDGWRKPRGIHSKMREAIRSKPAVVSPGYRSAKSIRGLHPSGYEEVYVTTVSQLQKVNAKTQAARLAGGIGERKRKIFVESAKKIGVKLLNA